MKIRLDKATDSDAQVIFDMQVKAFMPLLEKYKDYDTNPANEPIENVIRRINYSSGDFYKIYYNDVLVGAICIYWKEETKFWISPMFILPEYQGLGIAQKAIQLIEEQFPQAATWELRTILEEKRNCYLYEKVGYRLNGETIRLNENITLVSYKKIC
ncbi:MULTISPECIES: GNAT family N-acetyltransferase [Bacillaceae]|uniref:GNAT family N-acetyltransferase n=1 Tax=Bacillaceae TaxID=186817 RepID=UPI000BEB9296|nr:MULTISPECIES: GNAT family N-acetyltransferase [unclassified Bacillus (in: firmicutes)]PEC47996.1 GNAT family N-acetyltransferase [Bacillus sp. AFS096315]PFM83310.1 GNAT family N-acetyltransferase [Bacillus sp. AFS077874]